MTKTRDLILGVLSIIIGFIGFLSPLLNAEVASKIAGILTLFVSIYLLVFGSKKLISGKIIGLLALIVGIMLIYSSYNRFTDVYYYMYVFSVTAYLTAILAIIIGVYILIHVKNNKSRITGIIGVALGVLYILVGYLIQNPVYLGIIVSLYLIIFGLSKIFGFNFYRIGTVMNKLIKMIYRNLKEKK